ncbi:hypothetical protein OEZ85_007341 [Tetradesmus obliquus]|uniref:GH18 domain-containing protein n=1 Tax=Tetradesmus obliquus TaxID=3088 RepID=A0ABY8TZI7_TETOB|nr:hypothetical protein OEZ85_007341 [Tetradesmus obliquus]
MIATVKVCLGRPNSPCDILDSSNANNNERAKAIIESKAGISISWCIGTKEIAAALKFLGISVCLKAEVAVYPVQGAVKVNAALSVTIVSFVVEFHFQFTDQPKNALKLCDTEKQCNANTYCQTAAGEWKAYFQIKITFLFWKQTVLDVPIGGKPSGCAASKAKNNIAKTKINKVVLYTTDWAQWRGSNNGRPGWCDAYAHRPADIDPSLATHINYAFAKIDSKTFEVVNVEANEDELIAGLQGLKAKNPALKTLISIGGWSFSRGDEVFKGSGSEKVFPEVAASAANRAAFIRSAIDYTNKRGFDGIDIDWEFPNFDGKAPQEVADFTSLMAELGTATKAAGMLLTTAMRATPDPQQHANVKAVAAAVDFINLMTYDYHGAFDFGSGYRKVNTHTPVLSCVNPLKKGWDIAGAIDAYEKQGAPLNKLVFGLGTYGRGFRFAGGEMRPGLGSALNSDEGQPLQGECTQTKYTLAWYEIKKVVAKSIIDPVQMAAYGVTTSGHWVGFDTPETHRMKMCYARARGISGVMVWDSDTDDQMELMRNIKANVADACKDFEMPRC